MKFDRFPLTDAAGVILAHSIATPDGVIKKGRILGPREIMRLEAAGIDSVIAARLEPGDVGEDEAARRLATAAAGPGVRGSQPFTGRANLFADAAGVAVIDQELVVRLNDIDEGLTIATVSPLERVEPGQMIATVKIITFALPEAVVSAAEALLRGSSRPLASVSPFRPHRAGLILTRMASTKDNVLAKRRRAIEGRLEALGSSLASVEVVAHEATAVSAALKRLHASGAKPIILFAASAIVDRGDVIPSALIASGGQIERLGMPVDPGNLMLLGRLGPVDVIGAPSCAASPKLNGFDWILERRLAGLPVGFAEVARMGVGGLLKEIPTRPQPRDEVPVDPVADPEPVRKAPKIAAVVLAAGRSTRFGPSNKLLASLEGLPLVRRTVMSVLASAARPVLVVTGHMSAEVRAALAGLDVTFVDNPAYRDGLSTSLKAGLSALPAGLDGALVALGDMPRVSGKDIDRLIAGFAPKEGRAIVLPTYRGKRGNPVLFATRFLNELRNVEGDVGARHVIGQNGEEVAEVDLGHDGIFVDVDTPRALAELEARQGRD